MKYQIQPCSPKAAIKIEWIDCQYCNGCGWDNPAIAIDKCGSCNGQGQWTGVNVGIEPTPENTFPFSEMKVGECFTVMLSELTEKSIRNRISERNKTDIRKFLVIKHSEFECCEIARVM